jgi:hypothetical protein
MTDRIMKALSTTLGMWWATLCACALGIVLIGLTSRLGLATSRNFFNTPMASWERWILLALVVTLATCLAVAPFIRFLAIGWHCRFSEFTNRIRDGAVSSYLAQFWQRQLAETPAANTDTVVAEALFAKIYLSYDARRVFAAPVLLLLVLTFISAMLVVQTGIDACFDHACLAKPDAAVRNFPPVAGIFAPLGLGNAYLISDLVEDLEYQRWLASPPIPTPTPVATPTPTATTPLLPAEQRLEDAVAVLKAAAVKKDANATYPSRACVEAAFYNISRHGYTKFLQKVT